MLGASSEGGGAGAGAQIVVSTTVALFVMSIALENTASQLVSLPTSLPTIASVPMIAAYVLLSPKARMPTGEQAAIRWYGMLLLVLCVGELVRSVDTIGTPEWIAGAGVATVAMYAKLAAAFYALNGTLRARPRLFRFVIYVWAGTLSVLAALAVARVGLVAYEHVGRVGLVGENLNVAGHRWGGAAVGMAALLMKSRIAVNWRSAILIPGIVLLVLAAFGSGSRGATIAIVSGFGVSLLLGTQMRLRTVGRYAVVGAGLALFAYRAFQATDTIRDRWTSAVEAGSPGMRAELFRGSMALFAREPLVGYGCTYDELLGDEVQFGQAIVSHNTVTQVLLTAGLLGLVPFVGGVVATIRAAYRHVTTPMGGAVFAALVAALVSAQFGNWLHLKYFWLVLLLSVNARYLDGADVPAGVARRTVAGGVSRRDGRQV